jgi:hypothetical protein
MKMIMPAKPGWGPALGGFIPFWAARRYRAMGFAVETGFCFFKMAWIRRPAG